MIVVSTMTNFLRRIVNNQVDKRINEIIRSGRGLEPISISDAEAERRVSSFIVKENKQGVKNLSTLDCVLNLNLPAQQVDKILERFVEQKKIKEIEYV